MEVNYEKLFTALSDKTFNGHLKWIPVSCDLSSSFMTMFTTETGQRYNVFLTYTKLHQEWDYYVDCLEFFDENNVSLLQLHELDWSTEEGYIINRLIKEILLEHYKEVNEMERQSKEREKKEQEERNMKKQTIVDELALMISHVSCGIVKKC